MMDAECKDGARPWASLADCEAVGGYGKSPALLVVAAVTA
jgi:hypothetical protein